MRHDRSFDRLCVVSVLRGVRMCQQRLNTEMPIKHESLLLHVTRCVRRTILVCKYTYIYIYWPTLT